MNWQALITTLLVAACSSYALWNLMPRAWRGRLSLWSGRPAVAATPGCGGCDGCGGAKPAAQVALKPGESVVQVVRRIKPRA